MRSARYILVTCALLAASAPTACGGDDRLDTAATERELAVEVEERTGTEDVRVDCPDDVPRREGEVFECDLSAPGGVRSRVRAEQVDDDGAVEWTLVRP